MNVVAPVVLFVVGYVAGRWIQRSPVTADPDRRSCPLPLHDPAARPASPSRGGQHRNPQKEGT